MRAIKRKHNELESTHYNFQKIRKLNNEEYEEKSYAVCLMDNELAGLTDNLNNLTIKKNIGKNYYNVDNPEKIRVQVTTKIKKPIALLPILKTDNRFNFKKTFQQEIMMKSPESINSLN
jgi:hypothetical protein